MKAGAWTAAALLLVAVQARAADPCTEDAKQFCGDVKPGEGRVAECLKAKQEEVSPGCRNKLVSDEAFAKKTVEDFARACKDDLDRHCAAIEPGGGRIYGCLAQHQLELSDSCSGVITRFGAARELFSSMKASCKADSERLCGEHLESASELVECLRENAANLSKECNVADLDRLTEAAAVVSLLEQMTRQERVREALQVLQGIDSTAFARSQILIQIDGFERLLNRADAVRLLFNPQFVFGPGDRFSLQVKVPLLTVFPSAEGVQPQFGLGAVTTSAGWNFLNAWRTKHYVGFAVQWESASRPVVGGPWAVMPSYAVSVGFARWVSLTMQVWWLKSISGNPAYQRQSLLVFEPIVVFNLPGRTFVALDTKLGIDLTASVFVPVLKALGGLYTDRQKSLSITAWYQTALTNEAVDRTFKFGVGLGLAYYFDW